MEQAFYEAVPVQDSSGNPGNMALHRNPVRKTRCVELFPNYSTLC